MFTGIVEEIGKVEGFKRYGNLVKLKVSSREILDDVSTGDSIAVNGVCLTVTEKKDSCIYFEAISKTLEDTNLGNLKEKHHVNLERSLTVTKNISGHLVTGHIDCVGRIIDIKRLPSKQIKLCIKIPSKLMKFIVPKGSICIDGVSLTVFDVKLSSFWIFLTPFTLKKTTLKRRKINDYVNVEVDLIARYLDKIVSRHDGAVLDEDFLAKYGFLDGK